MLEKKKIIFSLSVHIDWMGHGSFTVQALFMAANEMWLHLSFLCLKVAGGNLQAQLCFLWNVNCVICSQLTPGKSVQWTRGSECHFSHASVTRFRQAFVTLVAGSWIHPGEACVVQVPVIQFDSLNCIVLELRVLANHDNIMAVVLKQLVLKALIGAPAHDFDYSNSIVSIVSFVSKQIWKQVMLHAENMICYFKGNPMNNNKHTTILFQTYVFGLDCFAIPAVWVAPIGEQVAKESATGRLIAHETNAIEQLDHLLSYFKSVRR